MKYNKPKIKKISATQLKREAKNAQLFVVNITERKIENEKELENNSEIDALLKEFKDVFPEELPAGLPQSRAVDHKIELIPGSTSPSKPTY